MRIYDLNRNFNHFLKTISISQENRKDLLSVRKILRSELRKAFNENRDMYITEAYDAILTKASTQSIKPKFMSQGSFVYGTINYSCNPPSQQMDLDDGIYIPLSYTDKLADSFQQASQVIRTIIYNYIQDACNAHQWVLHKKSKCLRVVINKDSHIDLPIYSIPDKELSTIQENASLALLSKQGMNDVLPKYHKADDILLATDNGWIESDPRDYLDKIEKIKQGDYRITFIEMSRYLKAWRDCRYPQDDSNLSSLAIMSGVYELISNPSFTQGENKALQLAYFVDGIKNLLFEQNGITDLTKNKIILKSSDCNLSLKNQLNNFYDVLNNAVQDGNSNHLSAQFGNRFPNENSHIYASILASKTAVNAAPVKLARDHL